MKLQIGLTDDGVISYPLHRHDFWEVMYYTEGNGSLHTPDCDYPYRPNTLIIVPPGILHGSVSENGFKNISVGGCFEHIFSFDKPLTLRDSDALEGLTLASLILDNRFKNDKYLLSLCSAYGYFILQNIGFQNPVNTAVNEIAGLITENAFNSEIKLTEFLLNSGYAEDYIRMNFKKITGKTPNEFLTRIRIEHACYLLDIYANSVPFSEIAEKCGYTDYVYFSKKFKSVTGLSPKEYVLSAKTSNFD